MLTYYIKDKFNLMPRLDKLDYIYYINNNGFRLDDTNCINYYCNDNQVSTEEAMKLIKEKYLNYYSEEEKALLRLEYKSKLEKIKFITDLIIYKNEIFSDVKFDNIIDFCFKNPNEKTLFKKVIGFKKLDDKLIEILNNDFDDEIGRAVRKLFEFLGDVDEIYNLIISKITNKDSYNRIMQILFLELRYIRNRETKINKFFNDIFNYYYENIENCIFDDFFIRFFINSNNNLTDENAYKLFEIISQNVYTNSDFCNFMVKYYVIGNVEFDLSKLDEINLIYNIDSRFLKDYGILEIDDERKKLIQTYFSLKKFYDNSYFMNLILGVLDITEDKFKDDLIKLTCFTFIEKLFNFGADISKSLDDTSIKDYQKDNFKKIIDTFIELVDGFKILENQMLMFLDNIIRKLKSVEKPNYLFISTVRDSVLDKSKNKKFRKLFIENMI